MYKYLLFFHSLTAFSKILLDTKFLEDCSPQKGQINPFGAQVFENDGKLGPPEGSFNNQKTNGIPGRTAQNFSNINEKKEQAYNLIPFLIN